MLPSSGGEITNPPTPPGMASWSLSLVLTAARQDRKPKAGQKKGGKAITPESCPTKRRAGRTADGSGGGTELAEKKGGRRWEIVKQRQEKVAEGNNHEAVSASVGWVWGFFRNWEGG